MIRYVVVLLIKGLFVLIQICRSNSVRNWYQFLVLFSLFVLFLYTAYIILSTARHAVHLKLDISAKALEIRYKVYSLMCCCLYIESTWIIYEPISCRPSRNFPLGRSAGSNFVNERNKCIFPRLIPFGTICDGIITKLKRFSPLYSVFRAIYNDRTFKTDGKGSHIH
jgi:hypothetical protein